ncbi:hypothetical protein [uncultured archaeal virus]|uniref:Uncharacterized protein n=1 Tax=uncultured archaeal virus TaxID=1960247 RepID=A0A8B0LP82_9VIRU|nr:hypothetical protein [uncultured archaeal virus]
MEFFKKNTIDKKIIDDKYYTRIKCVLSWAPINIKDKTIYEVRNMVKTERIKGIEDGKIRTKVFNYLCEVREKYLLEGRVRSSREEMAIRVKCCRDMSDLYSDVFDYTDWSMHDEEKDERDRYQFLIRIEKEDERRKQEDEIRKQIKQEDERKKQEDDVRIGAVRGRVQALNPHTGKWIRKIQERIKNKNRMNIDKEDYITNVYFNDFKDKLFTQLEIIKNSFDSTNLKIEVLTTTNTKIEEFICKEKMKERIIQYREELAAEANAIRTHIHDNVK